MKNRILFIVIGVILLCCCVVVIAGAVAYPTIKNYLNSASSGLQNLNPPATSGPETATTSQPSSGPVDGGLGDSTLKTDVWNAILNAESGRGCNDATSTGIDVVQQHDTKGVWVENWTVDACGTTSVLKVTFTLDPKGGMNYAITPQ